MARELEALPLFPLHTVLFPYATIQLHVFEERYRSMVQHCLDYDAPFGVVLIRNGPEVGGIADPYMVGTAVRIVHVYNYEDGKMDIQIYGERRFRIRKIDESKEYLVGHVEPVIEMEAEEGPMVDELVDHARTSFKTLIEGMLARPDFNIQVIFPPDATALSFVIANYLHLENLEKQRLLETTDTVERLQELVPLIERQIVQAKKTQTFRLSRELLSDWIHPN